MPHNLFANTVCPSRKVRDFDEKRLFGASIVRAQKKYSNLQVDRSLVFSPDQCQYYPKDNPAFSSPKWVKQQHTMQWFEMISEEFNLFSYSIGNQEFKKLVVKVSKSRKRNTKFSHTPKNPTKYFTFFCPSQ